MTTFFRLSLLSMVGAGLLVESGHMTPVGVCGDSPGAFSCWDMNGNNAPNLLRSLGNRVGSVPSPSPSSEIRFVIFREKEPFGGAFGMADGTEILGPIETAAERYLVLRTPASISRKTFDFQFRYAQPLEPQFELPFRNGASRLGEGPRFQVGKAFEVEKERILSISAQFEKTNRGEALPERLVTATGIRMWEVPVGVQESLDPSLTATISPLDTSGEPIEYVDRRGRPLSAKQARNLISRTRSISDPDLDGKAFPAMFWIRGGRSLVPAAWCDTNISPSSIRRLRVRLFHTVSSGPISFPTDPN